MVAGLCHFFFFFAFSPGVMGRRKNAARQVEITKRRNNARRKDEKTEPATSCYSNKNRRQNRLKQRKCHFRPN